MVEFSQTDFKVLLVMTVFVIFISFVFPPMGFTSENINGTEIPSFNASQGQFSHLEEPSERPGQPNEGTLEWINNSKSYEDNRNVFIADEAAISTYNQGDAQNPDIVVTLADYTVQPSNLTTKSITTDEYVVIENYSYGISYENLQFGENNQSYTIDWEVHERPDTTDSSGWVDSIPIIGGLVSGASELGGAILWIGQIIFRVVVNVIISVGNVFITLFNVITFLLSFFYWILSTYGAVIASSPNAWATVFMAIPGLALSFEFAKVIILVIQTVLRGIPFT